MKSKILSKYVPAMVAIWGLIIFCPLLGFGTSITIPQKDITFDCRVEPEPELGKEFTVTVTFSLNEATEYYDNPNAKAVATIGMLFPQEYITGDTMIAGKYSAGERHTLSATYIAIRPGICLIDVNVNIKGEKKPCEKDYMGHCIDGYREIYSSSTLYCGEYYISPAVPIHKDTILDSAIGLKISNVIFESNADLIKIKVPYEINVDGKSTGNKPPRRPATEEEWIARHKTAKGIVNERRVYLEKLSDGSYQQIIDVYIPDTTIEWRIIFKDHETYEILYPDFPTTKGDWGSIKYQKDSTYIFRPSMIGDDLKIKGKINNKDFDLILNVSSSWILDGTIDSSILTNVIISKKSVL